MPLIPELEPMQVLVQKDATTLVVHSSELESYESTGWLLVSERPKSLALPMNTMVLVQKGGVTLEIDAGALPDYEFNRWELVAQPAPAPAQ